MIPLALFSHWIGARRGAMEAGKGHDTRMDNLRTEHRAAIDEQKGVHEKTLKCRLDDALQQQQRKLTDQKAQARLAQAELMAAHFKKSKEETDQLRMKYELKLQESRKELGDVTSKQKVVTQFIAESMFAATVVGPAHRVRPLL